MSLENPLSILYNSNGVEVAVSASQPIDVSGSQPGIMIAGSGSDGNAYLLRSTPQGDLFVTGAVGLSNGFGTSTNPFTVSITQSAGSAGSETNPIFITSSLTNPVYVSVSSSNNNPVYISGTVNGTFSPAPNTPVSQGNPGSISDAWNIKITDGTQVLGTGSSAPLWVTGTVGFASGLGSAADPLYITSSLTSPVYVSVSSSNAAPVTVVFSGNLGTTNAPLTVTLSGANGSSGNAFYVTSSATSPVYVTGSFAVNFNPSTSATVTSSVGTTSTVTLLAANVNRRAATFYNDSNKILFLKLGTAATQTDFSVKISAQGYYEVPGDYTGVITGQWNGVNGSAYITEILD